MLHALTPMLRTPAFKETLAFYTQVLGFSHGLQPQGGGEPCAATARN